LLTARLALVGVCLAVLLPGCSTNPATGESSFTAFMSPAEEAQVGGQEDPKIRQQFGGNYDDPALADYVAAIGRELARHSELPADHFRFTVLNSPTVNAFALPGGYVYVTRGLLALAGSEAELAGVLAHEIGHVTARHTAQRYSRSVVTGLGATLVGALVGNRGIGNLLNLGANLYLKSYSREHELEADALGIRYLRSAGYDAAAMAGFLNRLRDHGKWLARNQAGARDPDQGDLMASHPRTLDRVRAAQALAAKALAGDARARGVGGGATKHREAYLRAIDGLLYGADPKQGIVRGSEYLHPELGFRFEVPPGFKIANRPHQVVAAGPDGVRIAFDAAKQPVRGPLTHYLRRVWGANLPIHLVEPINLNGYAGATGGARVTTRYGPVDLRLVVFRFDARRVYRFLFLTPPEVTSRYEVALRRTTYSFRGLSARERRQAPVQRLRVVTVGRGDTLDKLVRRMPEELQSSDLFRTLNGLPAGTGPSPGERVKIITQ
jgi:predicted Zn-dependent protease